jgi:hypothetical protein
LDDDAPIISSDRQTDLALSSPKFKSRSVILRADDRNQIADRTYVKCTSVVACACAGYVTDKLRIGRGWDVRRCRAECLDERLKIGDSLKDRWRLLFGA